MASSLIIYSKPWGSCSLIPQTNPIIGNETKLLMLPFCGYRPSKIGRLVDKYDLKPVYYPLTKLRHWLFHINDPLGLQTPGIYRVPFSCGKIYIEQTGHTVTEHFKRNMTTILDLKIRLSAPLFKAGTSTCFWLNCRNLKSGKFVA